MDGSEVKFGWQVLADSLCEKEVETIFTLPGASIVSMHLGIEDSPVNLISTRHEQGAVFMAEAYARLKRSVGVAMVTTGPGFTNAVTPLVNSKFANSPIILISGTHGIQSDERLDMQELTQIPIVNSLVKRALSCRSVERIPEFSEMAYHTALSGRPGPVYLEIPVDVLNASVKETDIKKFHTSLDSRPFEKGKADAMVEMLLNSKQPFVIAGSGAYYSDAGHELIKFVESTGVPVFTNMAGRGLVSDDHPMCFEASTVTRPGASFKAFFESDLIILLGHRISFYYACGDIFNKNAKMIQVDIHEEEIGRNRSIDLPIVGDIRAFLRECNSIIERRGIESKLKSNFESWIASLKEFEKNSKAMAKLNEMSDNVPIHPGRLAREIDNFMNKKNDMVVVDGGDVLNWSMMTRTCQNPWNYLDAGMFGCLGVGIPFANTAKYLFPDSRVLLFIGDGAIGFNFFEIETAIRNKLQIVIVVSNNQCWSQTRHGQRVRYGKITRSSLEFTNTEYHKLVEAMGGFGILVEKPDEIKPALVEAFKSGKVACINVMTDSEIMNPVIAAIAMKEGYKFL